MNRGRIQAQGDRCQKSEPWAQVDIPTKGEGFDMSKRLKTQLTKKELKIREYCFQKLERFIRQAPHDGYDANVKPSFILSPPLRDIRVDAEIIKGRAFKN